MSSVNTLTGRNGKAVVDDSLVKKLTKWDVNPTLASNAEWGDSDSAGYTNRATGRRDATYTSEGKYDTSDEQFDLFAPGDTIEGVLWMDASALYWAFPRALCTDFTLAVDVDTEEVIGWTGNFGADGIFYRPGQSGAPTHTLPS